jgi:hypothetical protein
VRRNTRVRSTKILNLIGVLRFMQWIPDQDAKPEMYRLVAIRCSDRNGRTSQREAFWTGRTWRIIGDKHKLHIAIIEWSYLGDSSRASTLVGFVAQLSIQAISLALSGPPSRSLLRGVQ